jgi:hypothetical protein
MKKLALIPLAITLLFGSTDSVIIEKNIYLDLDGKRFEISTIDGGEIKLNGKSYKVKAGFTPLSRFNHKNIDFKFSSSCSVNFDEVPEQGPKIWTIDASTSSMALMEYSGTYKESEILNSMMEEYQAIGANIEKSDITLTTKSGVTLKGKRFKIHIGDVVILQDIFVIYGDGKTFVLVLQDTLNEKNQETEEFKEFKKVFEETLNLKGVKQ